MANVDLVMRLLAEDRASDKFKKVGDSAKRTETSFSKLGRTAAGALAGIGIAAFAKQSIEKFAAVQDAQSALQATYGKTADAFIDFANNSADALNLSKREALEAAANFANFGRAAGLAGADLQKFTTPLIERAADAASYFGGSTSDAIEAFGAALRGEMEPIRRYGVLLDDATLRAKALEMGLVSSTKNALTPQTKTLAAQALILEKTSQAQGDVARTSDSMANQIKDAAQQMDDFQTSVGETLSVAVGPLLKGLNGATGAFNKLPQPVKSAALVIGAVGVAAVVAGPRILALRREMLAAGVAGGRMASGMKGAAKAASIAGISLAVANPIVSSIGDNMFGAITPADRLNESLLRLAAGDKTARIGEFGGKLHELGAEVEHLANPGISQRVEDFFGTLAGNGGGEGRNRVLAQIKELDGALSKLVDDGKGTEAAAVFKQLSEQTVAAGGSVDDLTGLLPEYANAQAAATRATQTATVTTDYNAAATARLKAAVLQLQGVLDRRAALRAWKGALDDAGAAVKAAGGHFTTGTAKGRAFQDWLDNSIGSLSAYASGASTAAGQSKRWKDGLGDLREKLSKMGLSDKEIAKILKPFAAMKTAAVQAGKETALGLAAGMDDKANFAIARARALGKAAALAVKDGAQVNSPSKITIEAGIGLMEGVEVGAVRRAGLTKKQLKKIMGESLSGAKDALEKFRDHGREVLDFINGIKDSVKGFGSVAGFQGSEDTPTTTASVIGDMASRVAKAKKFGSVLQQLKKLGLNNSSIQEIIAAGPKDGLEIAEALLAGGLSAVKQVNSLEAQLTGAGQAIGDVGGLSQYGLTGAQAKAIATTTISVQKGGIVINFGAGIDKKSKADFEDDVEAIVRRVVRKLGKRARGGPVAAGSTYVVGENQAELFSPSRSGVILPSVNRGGGQARVNVYLDGRMVQSSLVDLERRQGGLLFGRG